MKKTNTNHSFSIGIKKIDKLVQRWPDKNFILLSGTEGSGKLIFSMQFLVHGITEYNQNGLYITLEDEEQEVKNLLNTFSWKLEELEKKKKLEIIKPETLSVQAIIKYIEDEKDRLDIKRIVINPINLLSASAKELVTIRKNLSDLKRKVFNLNCNCIVVSDAIQSNYYQYSYSGYEEFVATSHIHLSLEFDRKKNNSKRYIELLKLKGCNHPVKRLEFKITKNGIE
ncbi:MAG: hypothetical protein N3E37_00420 [Candidatus Micrarchaeota archaeon]|nr:hypothetical protein [Candidatus Micrarchaeota archaeon]